MQGLCLLIHSEWKATANTIGSSLLPAFFRPLSQPAECNPPGVHPGLEPHKLSPTGSVSVTFLASPSHLISNFQTVCHHFSLPNPQEDSSGFPKYAQNHGSFRILLAESRYPNISHPVVISSPRFSFGVLYHRWITWLMESMDLCRNG